MEEDGEAKIPFGDPARHERRAERLRACRTRVLHRIVLLLLAAAFVVAGFFARLAAVGLPAAWVERLEALVSSGSFAVELDRVTFSVASGSLRIGEANVYQTGLLRPPVARVQGAAIVVRPKPCRPDATWIDSVEIAELSVSMPAFGEEPEAAAEAESPNEDRGPTIPDFPAVAFRCRRADILGLRAHGLNGLVSARDGVIEVHEAHARFNAPGEIAQRMEGSVKIDPVAYTFSSDGQGSLDPNKLAALLETVDAPSVVRELAKFEFPAAAPRVEAAYRYDPAHGVRTLRLALEGGMSLYNGVQISGFRGVADVGGDGAWNRVGVEDLHVERPEGAVDGRLDLDLDGETIDFRAVSTIDPLRCAAMIGLLDAETDLPLAFENPTVVTAEGVFGFSDSSEERTSIRISARAPALDAKGVRFTGVSADGTMEGTVLDVPEISAAVFGGTLEGSLCLALASASCPTSRLAAAVELKDVRHEEFSRVAGSAVEDSRGRLDLTAELAGPLDDIVSTALLRTTASGRLSMRDCRVFRVPFFSGAGDLLSGSVPGVDLLLEEDRLVAKGTYEDGRLQLTRLDIQGSVFSIRGRGRAWRDGEIDLTLDVHPFNRGSWIGKGVYYLFTPLAKILAIRATGTVRNPRWSSARLSSGSDRK